MQITKLSSSLISSYTFCNFQYFLRYVLELESSGSGKAATTGTIVHQALEWASRLKKKNKINVDPEWLFERSWNEHPHPNLRKFTSKGLSADYKKCKASFFKIIEDEFYNPYNLKIIDAERWFEIELPGPEWEVKKDGKTKQLAVRGYMDLIHELNENTIEIVDYKTGLRSSPFDPTTMDFYGLTKKLQAKIYFMASKILLPQYKNCIVTFYYTGDGPTTIGLSDEELPQILSQLFSIFQQIKGDSLIKRNRSWKCKLCQFSKNDICDKVWGELNTMGERYVKNKYHNINIGDINNG
jgi:ATP-dependent helicase/DNAse subunit B